ncbi:alkyl sulfatase BDS1-like metallo-beta-lactamase superfamily hydrolase [Rhodococcus sp. LBL1]|nr:alkyl sulfatase BDS1-like metallo-beta-lactamase superfamily hydrolase [Rhodococcus sp. LBL1]MDH6685226.1 alkyl sulfatase BDS1-like metallo-beta-lactamase superfamily hydrolase [Rhodococcus sp. LBL2]
MIDANRSTNVTSDWGFAMTVPADATPEIVAANARSVASLPDEDAADVERGFVAAMTTSVVRDDGTVVWDNDSYSYLDAECPPTVNPSLWRRSRLASKQGLFEVCGGIYQVRGLDISNMTIVEGDTGVVVFDPLSSAETAAAALALYRQHRGDRPVVGVIHTHSHVDHFGGVKGVTDIESVEAGRCPVIAPAGLVEHAVSENVYVGTATARRAVYMNGTALPRNPRGSVRSGPGGPTSTGTVTLVAPTVLVEQAGHTETVDGVRFEFQPTPGTGAPAEMNVHLPDRRALCLAENATHTLRNLLTLSGAPVRDPHVWAKHLTDAIHRYAADSDVLFGSHHWPKWGTERLTEFLARQRDVYAYLHDQTVRRMNQGSTGIEIAEELELPPVLGKSWHARGYYGSISHTVKAIYQRYAGWFDGNPAHLWDYPPVESAKRHVEFMGGSAEVLRKARKSFADGDFRWVAQVVDYVVFADPDNVDARELQAATLEQLGYGAENSAWRNAYLTGATELCSGPIGSRTQVAAADLARTLSVEQLFDAISLRVDGPKAWHARIVIDWAITDDERVHRMELRNGVLVHWDLDDARPVPDPDARFIITRSLLFGVLLGLVDLPEAIADGRVDAVGDVRRLSEFANYLDDPDPGFAIVTP